MHDIKKKYGALIANLTFHDETFTEALPALIEDFHSDRQVCIERKHPFEKNPYLICKSQLETLLTERNIDDIEDVMVKSENRGPYGDDPETRRELAACHAQFLERIYHEIYKDDPEFRPELVRTPVEELLKMHF